MSGRQRTVTEREVEGGREREREVGGVNKIWLKI